jgi:hypothetical protein
MPGYPVSTRNTSRMPDIPGFRRLAQSLAMLDAIVSPEWQHRYYSYNARWADGEHMASMRDGEGNHWFAWIGDAGIALHGLWHESPVFRLGNPEVGIFEHLPEHFHGPLRDEPAFDTRNSTFCLWRSPADAAWSVGPVKLPRGKDPDGSGALLSILAGDPAQYVEFARAYYERALAIDDVAAIYAHTRLDPARVGRLNPEVALGDLADDVAEIGYPA